MGALISPRGRFTGAAREIPANVVERMRGRSWRDDARCPPLAELSYLQLDHRTLDGTSARGELIVAHRIAGETVALFRRLWMIGFPIASLRLIDDFDGDDERSMSADNSSGFNFRTVAGSDELSQHAFGLAIDLNPVENPWVHPDRFVPPEAAAFLDRTQLRPGMIVRPGPVVRILDELGWEWGGDWLHAHDHHHIVWRR